MKGKNINRLTGTVCAAVLALLLMTGSVFAGEMAPVPGAQPSHSKIAKPAKQPLASTSASSNRDLTWFEMVEIALSNLGLL